MMETPAQSQDELKRNRQADERFISTHLEQIEGWCMTEAPHVTCWLIDTVAAATGRCAVVEIGVFKGKFLSALYHKARRNSGTTLGIDTFQWSSAEGVLNEYRRIFGDTAGLTLLTRDSQTMSAEELNALCGGPVTFFSVDGAHTAPEVTNDIALADSVLHPAGIIAVDDFVNPHAIGVSEGTYTYFFTRKPNLAPFLWSGNKLFCCRPEQAEKYKVAVLDFAAAARNLPFAAAFLERLETGRAWVEQRLLGTSIYIL